MKIKKRETQKVVLQKENLNIRIRIVKCLEAAQIENKIIHWEKNDIDVDSLKEFIINNKLIL